MTTAETSASMFAGDEARVAVLIPCYNERATVAEVVRGFREHLPGAAVYVYDNNSSDGTPEAARAAGAVVRREARQGKGNVVRRMLADIEADAYVLVDGDSTYDPSTAPAMVERVLGDGQDMVVAARVGAVEGQYRAGHRLGNALFTRSIALLFGTQFTDVLSGYRCFSRRFAKSFPSVSSGFEIETELTTHCLNMRLPASEIASAYAARPEGSESKLSTYADGWRILNAIVLLCKEFRPLLFFGGLGAVFALLSLAFGVPVVLEFLESGLVPRFPTAILATGLMILAFLMLTAGLVLDSTARMRLEAKRLAYLAHAGPPAGSVAGGGRSTGDRSRITEVAPFSARSAGGRRPRA